MENTSIRFSESELKEISDLQTSYQNNLLKFGHLQIKKYSIEEEIQNLTKMEEELKEEYINIQTKESELLNKLTEKYGEGSLNTTNGTFTPISQKK